MSAFAWMTQLAVSAPARMKALSHAGVYALALFVTGFLAGEGYSQFAAPIATPAATCRTDALPMARLELLFGTARDNHAPVTAGEWTAFLDAEVSPRFPAGLTVLSGPGQWRDKGGAIEKERAMMLVIWYDMSSQANGHIEAIRAAYKRKFDQDSVMRIDGVSCVSF